MADFDYYGADYGLEDGPRFLGAFRAFGVANWMGAVTSVGLTAGLAVWAVDLTFRDVSTVPVILALEGPMRVEPTDPGGVVAPFQGMALSDITSGGAAAPAPDQIVLAPPPVAIEAPALAERVAAVASAPAPEASAATDDAPVTLLADLGASGARPAPVEADEVDLAMLDAGGTDAIELAPAEAGEVLLAAADSTSGLDFRSAIAAAIAEAQPGAAAPVAPIATSLRPMRRPTVPSRLAASTPIEAPAFEGGVAVASAGMPDRSLTDAAMASSREVDPSTLVAGTRIVQLGAFDSAAVARAEWDRLEARFGDYMAGKRRLVEPAQAGGRDFWRLRAVGFADGDEARRFCAQLVAHDAACIPVTVR